MTDAGSYASALEELGEAMDTARSEQEAHELLRRHLERAIPDSAAVVFRRDKSEGRLEAATTLSRSTVLAEKLVGAEPEACLALRLRRLYERRPGEEPLMSCEICSALARSSVCVPSQLTGEPTGSVLVLREVPLTPAERELVQESMKRAAPALVHLRKLARSESRSYTDALTGLLSQLALRENLPRMIAEASRRIAPLAAITMGIDQLEQIGDVFGRSARDDALKLAAQTLAATARSSDMICRYEGDEFVILQPDTDREGALVLAEKLKTAIGEIDVPGIDRSLTASFGIAAFPRDGVDSETLLASAESALQAARSKGSNRVEIVSSEPEVADG
jgi:diguanylate cyclase (GGDEF)-like protein